MTGRLKRGSFYTIIRSFKNALCPGMNLISIDRFNFFNGFVALFANYFDRYTIFLRSIFLTYLTK